MAADKKNLSDVAKGLGLTEIDTASAVSYLRDDILLTMWRGSSDASLRDRIERVYKEWHPAGEFKDDGLAVSSIFLIGPPGQGKTTSFKVACQEVSKALGLRYLENGDIDKAINNGGIQSTDFVFVSQETAGVVSALEWAGLPTSKIQKVKDKAGVESERKVMGRLHSQRLQALEDAAGGCLLLDDFSNATPSIQNVGLSLSEEKRYGDLSLSRSYVGMTGNMGSVDGTHTSKNSSALRNRCQVYFTQDKLDNFIARTQTNPVYRDDIGDLGVCAFLERNRNLFADMPDTKEMGGYTTPRSWDKFIAAGRKEVRKAGGRGQGVIDSMSTLRNLSASLLGLQTAHEYTIFLHSMMKDADPIARLVINEGKVDSEKLKKNYGSGYAAENQHFAYQYAHALADYAVSKIVRDGGDLKESIHRFAIGLTLLEGASFTFGVNALRVKLANTVESMSVKTQAGGRDLSMPTKTTITQIVSKHTGITSDQISNLVDALSNFDKMATKTTRSRK